MMNKVFRKAGLLLLLMGGAVLAFAQNFGNTSFISETPVKGGFELFRSGKSISIVTDPNDHKGVLRAAEDLHEDIGLVTMSTNNSVSSKINSNCAIIIAGTLGNHALIDQLVEKGKLNKNDLTGKRETFIIQVVDKPFPKVDKALVIAGSDKRGTIYGIYELSEQIGVSPWTWWADVPVKPKKSIYVLPGTHSLGEPKVKYRGIFINDEAPALSGWTKEKFGGFNSKFYVHVFELILRLKGNFLWPAMWGNAFYDDDPMNPVLADEYGVVIGTSHHEPMMRAHDEWRRYGGGTEWNYLTNENRLKDYWRESIRRTGRKESIITLGMRGDGDMPMTQGTAIELLERIILDQRKILVEETGKKEDAMPQVWALYKEVQDYYDKGMRVPDDVTLLLCDDNWGNIRKLPQIGAKPRKGGYGVYYHFDYVGGPRNYKWLNTNPLPRIHEQMNLAWHYGAREIWVVNVGDIKPMEFPISFFLDFAWNPDAISATQVQAYTEFWAAKQFGSTHAGEIADLLAKYAKYNARRKPELLYVNTYSLFNNREWEGVVKEYTDLLKRAEELNSKLPSDYRDAFYQLVLHPIQACSNLNALYYSVALNRHYATQKRSATNTMAEKARMLFQKDAEISAFYNKKLAGGKWNHMMDQTHIGYTYWQQPPVDIMPEVRDYEPENDAKAGIAVEGNPLARFDNLDPLVLPEMTSLQPAVTRYIEIFNTGRTPFSFQINSQSEYLILSSSKGSLDLEQRIEVSVNWEKVPTGRHRDKLSIQTSTMQKFDVYVDLYKPEKALLKDFSGFLESEGLVSMPAENYNRKNETGNIIWQHLPDLGRRSGAMTYYPLTDSISGLPGTGPNLEYYFFSAKVGEVGVWVYLAPTLPFNESAGLRYGISIDDEPVQVINIHQDKSQQNWERSVAENVRRLYSRHRITANGKHTLKFWAIDPGVVFQHVVVDFGGLKSLYLEPVPSPGIEK